MRHTEQEEACVHEAMALLPWYVNGTLGLEERRAIEDHLATCVLCPDELIALLKVQDVLRRELAEAPEPSAALWQKVRGRIAESPVVADQTQAADVRPPGRSAWAWLSNLLGPALRPGWALAALGVIVIQAVLILGLATRGPWWGGGEYRTLTGPTIAERHSGPRVRLRVAFSEEAPEQAIRAVLGELKATIADGPSAAGFYLIDVPLDGGSLQTPDEALRALLSRTTVVRFAELAAE
jgi:hypothetical protein